jgi:hypothetical protein
MTTSEQVSQFLTSISLLLLNRFCSCTQDLQIA